MADYKNWDDLTDDIARLGEIASFKVDILLQIYGTHDITSDISEAIHKSLLRRDYEMQPASLVGLSKDDYVRVYYKESFFDIIKAAQDPSPSGNEVLRRIIGESHRNSKIQELIRLAKEITKD